jgi:DNA-binding XRE family transcriptional regulator
MLSSVLYVEQHALSLGCQARRTTLSTMPIIPAQCRAARALVEMDQADLARKAVVSRNVIVDFERGSRTPLANNLAAIKRVLEENGVEFTNGEQPGVRLRKRDG